MSMGNADQIEFVENRMILALDGNKLLLLEAVVSMEVCEETDIFVE